MEVVMTSLALATKAETDPPTAPRLIHVATSYACDRATRELGEDYEELKKVERAYRLLERRLTRAAPALQARRAIESVTEFNLLLADARHDASFGALLSLAKDAAAEARVVKLARTFAPQR